MSAQNPLLAWARGESAVRYRASPATRLADWLHARRGRRRPPPRGWPVGAQAWTAPDAESLSRPADFKCNVCGTTNRALLRDLGRESPTCRRCGSTVRLRSMIDLLSRALFDASLAIPGFPRSDKCGIGLSDDFSYAGRLAGRIHYVNTFYHKPPRLDACAPPAALRGACDFIIASDVLEHVAPPVSRAFEGLHSLLRPGGALIGSVPYSLDETPTLEHYPTLHDFRLVERDGVLQLHNRRLDGTEEVFERPVFHGGEGETLEMRLFSRTSLTQELHAAGFSAVHYCERDVPEWGIAWLAPWSIPFVALR